MSENKSGDNRKAETNFWEDFSLYPKDSVRSLWLGLLWLASFGVGVLLPYSPFTITDTTQLVGLGGAGFMFAASMMVEFSPTNTGQYRKEGAAHVLHSLFVVVLSFMAFHAFILLVDSRIDTGKLSAWTMPFFCIYSVLIILRMFIGAICGMFVRPYDHKAEEEKKEADYQKERDRFTAQAEGIRKGGEEP